LRTFISGQDPWEAIMDIPNIQTTNRGIPF
jgi:hypothetical protein